MNIIEQREIDLFSTGEFYVKDLNIRINKYTDTIYITDLTNALRTGKVCKQVVIDALERNDIVSVVEYTELLLVDIKKLFEIVSEETGHMDVEDSGVRVYCRERKSIRTFSPFNIKFLKPLTMVPKKWKIKDAIRALVNGQGTDLHKTLRLTDDYAYDSAYNFGKGLIEDVFEFCRGILENPSGWRVSEDNGVVHVNCHHFDYNEFDLKINVK